MARILYLHGKPRPIEQFTRIGYNEHRQLATLHASGRLPIKRAVFEATYLTGQSDLLNTRGARPFLACNTPSCCPRGPDDMLSAHKAHFLTQRNLQLQDLSGVPEPRRAQHYIEKHLAEANRQAQRAAKLKIGDEKLAKTLKKNSERLDNVHRVAEALYKLLPETTRSAPPAWRNGRGSDRAQDGR